MIRLLSDLLGLVLVGLGILTLPTPIPIGLVLIALGALILAANEEVVRKEIRTARATHKPFDTAMRTLGKTLPGIFKEIVKKTDPS